MADEGRLIEEQSTERRARILNIAFYNTAVHQPQLFSDILSVDEMYSLRAVPLAVDSHNILFGITNNTSQATMNNLAQKFSEQRVSFSLISDSGYKDFMRLYDPPKQIVYQDINLINHNDLTQLHNVSDTLNSVRADDMLAYIVQQAYRLNASDIHIETEEQDIRIRFRVDGVLHPIAYITQDKYRQMMSSLAIAANISTNSDDAQTGHINKEYRMADETVVTVNLRVETVPTLYGMDVVLRLFNLHTELLSLEKLGLKPAESQVINDIISHPNGLVLIVGPTGSGKTTTLYSMINELNNPERKIITLEDPVEYNIPGITQIPINSRQEENGFANKFRAVLRLDPDVIMVGEIRDHDTAKTALQSALTGHLVLSTYHAGSSAAALTRMLDTIGDNPLFISAVRLVQAQRLLRRLDDSTKQVYVPDEQMMNWINKILDSMPNNVQKPDISNLQLYKAGYSEENPFGYSGQFAVRELMQMTPGLQQELKKPAHEITAYNLENIAIKDGMLTMVQDGVLRAIAGETSIEEVIRVLS